MRLLHTADWHVGKTIRGASRTAEHEAVLEEIAGIADAEQVGLVIMAGDLFDSAAPSPEAERVAYRALLRLSDDGRRPVVVVSGNHDNPRRLEAVAPVFAGANVHLIDKVARPADGGVLALDVDGTPVKIALLPFVSQRGIIGVDQLMAKDQGDHALAYADRLKRITDALAADFSDDAVNLVVAHAMVTGGVLGGGERSAHTIFEYSVPATAFPAGAHYVALGHLHRTQRIDGPCPIWYPGSPLPMDFGEQQDRKNVLVVEAAPGIPALVREVPLTSGRRFRTVRGTLAELRDEHGADAEAFLRVIVREAGRVGLVDDVRDLFPDAVEIRLEAPEVADGGGTGGVNRVEHREPRQLFADYLHGRNADDPRLLALFDQLYDEAMGEEVHDAS